MPDDLHHGSDRPCGAGKPDRAAHVVVTGGLPPVLKKRREFLACAKGARHSAPGLTLQARRRRPDETPEAGPRVGFTCSKKVGNAVARNRAKRRLREAARAVVPSVGRAGWDYVLIGRAAATVERPFAALLADVEAALARVHAPRGRRQRPERSRT